MASPWGDSWKRSGNDAWGASWGFTIAAVGSFPWVLIRRRRRA